MRMQPTLDGDRILRRELALWPRTLWKTTDAGKTWTKIQGSGFPEGLLGRIGIDVSRSNPNVIYAQIEVGASTGVAFSHTAQETGFVLRGAVEVTVGNESRVLREGDGYYFDSQTPHQFRNVGDTVAEISKRWFRVRDTYGIDVAPGEDDALILAAAVCIDEMAHD